METTVTIDTKHVTWADEVLDQPMDDLATAPTNFVYYAEREYDLCEAKGLAIVCPFLIAGGVGLIIWAASQSDPVGKTITYTVGAVAEAVGITGLIQVGIVVKKYFF